MWRTVLVLVLLLVTLTASAAEDGREDRLRSQGGFFAIGGGATVLWYWEPDHEDYDNPPELRHSVSPVPVVSLGFEAVENELHLFVALDALATLSGRSDDFLIPYVGGLTAGFGFGWEHAHLGAYATAGLVALGLGGRLVVTRGVKRRSGLEVRGGYAWPASVQLWALYRFSFGRVIREGFDGG